MNWLIGYFWNCWHCTNPTTVAIFKPCISWFSPLGSPSVFNFPTLARIKSHQQNSVVYFIDAICKSTWLIKLKSCGSNSNWNRFLLKSSFHCIAIAWWKAGEWMNFERSSCSFTDPSNSSSPWLIWIRILTGYSISLHK